MGTLEIIALFQTLGALIGWIGVGALAHGCYSITIVKRGQLLGVGGWACWVWPFTAACGIVPSYLTGAYFATFTSAAWAAAQLYIAVQNYRKRGNHWFFVDRPRC